MLKYGGKKHAYVSKDVFYLCYLCREKHRLYQTPLTEDVFYLSVIPFIAKRILNKFSMIE